MFWFGGWVGGWIDGWMDDMFFKLVGCMKTASLKLQHYDADNFVNLNLSDICYDIAVSKFTSEYITM